jgi:hypothetical protein
MSGTLIRRQPVVADALNIAALRWYVNRIENHAIGVYAACAELQADIQGVLHRCVQQLDALQPHASARSDEVVSQDDCPYGYHRDGNRCVPN